MTVRSTDAQIVVNASDVYRNDETLRLRRALELIAENGCENIWRGECWSNGFTVGATYGADRVCDACVARASLEGKHV